MTRTEPIGKLDSGESRPAAMFQIIDVCSIGKLRKVVLWELLPECGHPLHGITSGNAAEEAELGQFKMLSTPIGITLSSHDEAVSCCHMASRPSWL